MKAFNTVYILSPHLDDAVLSLGEHIINWKKQGKKIVVITVFTKFRTKKNIPEYSLNYIKQSGFESVRDFENFRVKEDIRAMRAMKVEYEHWGFIDAGFRSVYPTRNKLLSGKINKIDNQLVKKINNKINKITADLILLPFGVGKHVDHMIIKKAGQNLEKNILYYLESPYLWEKLNYFKNLKKIFKKVSFKKGTEKKDLLLKKYLSQYNLFTTRKKFDEIITK